MPTATSGDAHSKASVACAEGIGIGSDRTRGALVLVLDGMKRRSQRDHLMLLAIHHGDLVDCSISTSRRRGVLTPNLFKLDLLVHG